MVQLEVRLPFGHFLYSYGFKLYVKLKYTLFLLLKCCLKTFTVNLHNKKDNFGMKVQYVECSRCSVFLKMCHRFKIFLCRFWNKFCNLLRNKQSQQLLVVKNVNVKQNGQHILKYYIYITDNALINKRAVFSRSRSCLIVQEYTQSPLSPAVRYDILTLFVLKLNSTNTYGILSGLNFHTCLKAGLYFQEYVLDNYCSIVKQCYYLYL